MLYRKKRNLSTNHNERNKQYYREKRELLINTLGGKCVICGETNHDLLEFDHINPFTKNIDVSAHLTSTQLIQNEICKLQLLCRNCHKYKTLKDNSAFKMCGENNPSSKLTMEQVIEIRENTHQVHILIVCLHPNTVYLKRLL